MLYVISMQFFSAVKPKHVVGIDHEISKRSQKSIPDELYRRRKTFAFRPGQAVNVPLKGTLDFPGGRGPWDVLPVIIRAPYQAVTGPTRIPGFSPTGGFERKRNEVFGPNRRNKKPSNL